MLTKQRGFTLVELLVVIAIIGVLIALLLPAVQQAREAVRRMSCSNQLKQIGIAVHNYHDTYNMMPAGHNPSARGAWAVHIFPFMELDNAYDVYVQVQPWYRPENRPFRDLEFEDSWACPSARSGAVHWNDTYAEGFRGTYVGNGGIGTYHRDHENGLTAIGPFRVGHWMAFRDVTDGLTNTALVSEIKRPLATAGKDSRGTLIADSGANLFTANYTPNSLVEDFTEHCQSEPGICPCSSNGSKGPHQLTVRSWHPGGVELLRADGSVGFTPETVSLEIWQALATVQGGEVLEAN
ncbi:DUF1559 domain-containing protein [Bremerella sp. JC770]|uniref:DUF1559 family PulG-like putative transporter n=1 Tax=Bremerella sp. JC770 TaxID=3232137 RepID=UPI003458A5CA